MLGRTATETATIVKLLNSVVQVTLRQVRVAEGHRERLVAHELADAVQVHPFHREPRGERVPEVMPPEVLDHRPAGSLGTRCRKFVISIYAALRVHRRISLDP